MLAKTKPKEPFIITELLAKQMERLYLSGTQRYSDIAAELKVPYKVVNRYMTKWKRRNGLLKAHHELTAKPTSSINSELQFLRKFYLDHVTKELML